jgi:cytochrome c-type biogenesis protein CcmH
MIKKWRRKMSVKKANLIAGIGLLMVFLTVGVAFAQDGQPRQVSDNEVNAVARDLYCPVCENVPLDVCPTQACADWREDIREKLSMGWTTEQIRQDFATRYGERVLGTPRFQGFHIIFWVGGFLFALGVIALVAVFIFYRNFRGGKPLDAEPLPVYKSDTTSPGEEYIARLEEDLKKR